MARANLHVTLAFTVGMCSVWTSVLAQSPQSTAPFDFGAPGNATNGLVADDVVHLRVSVCDYAHAGTAAIGLGEPIAADVYRRAGVIVDWINGCQYDDPPDFQVNLLPDRLTPRAFQRLKVFGFGGSSQTVANVMWERIEEAAIEHRMAGGHLLGFVMAHELGHLLLPPNPHRWSGVMQPEIDFRAVQLHDLWFSREQAALILRKVQSIADRRRDSMAIASN